MRRHVHTNKAPRLVCSWRFCCIAAGAAGGRLLCCYSPAASPGARPLRSSMRPV